MPGRIDHHRPSTSPTVGIAWSQIGFVLHFRFLSKLAPKAGAACIIFCRKQPRAK
jgi:hypothetical protein